MNDGTISIGRVFDMNLIFQHPTFHFAKKLRVTPMKSPQSVFEELSELK